LRVCDKKPERIYYNYYRLDYKPVTTLISKRKNIYDFYFTGSN